MTETLIDLIDGKLSELDIFEPCWLHAGRLTDTETGASWRYVYRSAALRTDDDMFQPVLTWLNGAAPIGDAQIATDPEMMFGAAELTLWDA